MVFSPALSLFAQTRFANPRHYAHNLSPPRKVEQDTQGELASKLNMVEFQILFQIVFMPWERQSRKPSALLLRPLTIPAFPPTRPHCVRQDQALQTYRYQHSSGLRGICHSPAQRVFPAVSRTGDTPGIFTVHEVSSLDEWTSMLSIIPRACTCGSSTTK
jgi:hypothetical protein